MDLQFGSTRSPFSIFDRTLRKAWVMIRIIATQTIVFIAAERTSTVNALQAPGIIGKAWNITQSQYPVAQYEDAGKYGAPIRNTELFAILKISLWLCDSVVNGFTIPFVF